jgi:acyl carrier protein
MTTTVERLTQLIDEARRATDREPLDPPPAADTFLPEVIDSLVLATLIVLIEEEWDFEFADDMIEPEIFETLDALARFVSSVAS